MKTSPATDGELRLDHLLCEEHGYESRSRARDAILRGCVSLGGQRLLRPGRMVARDAGIEIDDPARAYVSRAALKLLHGLAASGFDPAGRTALDLGASTGGFTQVLLERSAAHVVALDAGHGQLHASLRADPRVTVIEECNARDLDKQMLRGHLPDFLVADLSFISLRLALPPALDLSLPGTQAILLVKPQFEAGKEAIGKGGVVRDAGVALRAAEDVRDWLDRQPGWRVIDMIASPIEGGDGNREFLLIAEKDGNGA